MNQEKTLLHATVSLLVKDGSVILPIKQKKIGAGCRNGYGGGIEDGESLVAAAIRELEEETGKKKGKPFVSALPEDFEKVAVIDFHNTKTTGETFVCRVHFFIVHVWSGEISDTDEMKDAQPFSIDNLPLDHMMPADRAFFPLILHGKKVIGKAVYGPFQKELLEEPEIIEVNSFEEE